MYIKYQTYKYENQPIYKGNEKDRYFLEKVSLITLNIKKKIIRV